MYWSIINNADSTPSSISYSRGWYPSEVYYSEYSSTMRNGLFCMLCYPGFLQTMLHRLREKPKEPGFTNGDARFVQRFVQLSRTFCKRCSSVCFVLHTLFLLSIGLTTVWGVIVLRLQKDTHTCFCRVDYFTQNTFKITKTMFKISRFYHNTHYLLNIYNNTVYRQPCQHFTNTLVHRFVPIF
jgi:hypothetical protein